jgi:hypothetical protein
VYHSDLRFFSSIASPFCRCAGALAISSKLRLRVSSTSNKALADVFEKSFQLSVNWCGGQIVDPELYMGFLDPEENGSLLNLEYGRVDLDVSLLHPCQTLICYIGWHVFVSSGKKIPGLFSEVEVDSINLLADQLISCNIHDLASITKILNLVLLSAGNSYKPIDLVTIDLIAKAV